MAGTYYRTVTAATPVVAYLRIPIKVRSSVAASMTILGLLPVTVTVATPAVMNLRAPYVARTLRVNTVVGVSLTYTVPTDSRTSYTALIVSSDNRLAIRDVVREVEPRVRGSTITVEEFGTVRYLTRVFACAEGLTTQAALHSMLALGTPMAADWTTEYYSLGVDGPKISGTTVGRIKDSADNIITVTFAEVFLPAPVARGYNETLRLAPVVEDATGKLVVTWGITNSRTGTNVPEVNDHLDGRLGLTAYRCRRVEFFDNRLPGRVLLRSTWGRRLADDPILEASNVA